MKKLFIEARKKFSENLDFSKLNNLQGKTISVAGTIQYLDLIPKVKDYLESKGKTVLIRKGAFHEGHVLGCNPSAFDESADTLLLLADGKFHAINNAAKLKKEIYVFNTHNLEKVEQKEIDKILKQIKGKQNKFLNAEKVALYMTTKPGQRNKEIFGLKNKIEAKGKECYVFESNNLDINDMENYPEIKVWINTACSGIQMDSNKIINLRDILEFI